MWGGQPLPPYPVPPVCVGGSVSTTLGVLQNGCGSQSTPLGALATILDLLTGEQTSSQLL